MMKMWRWYYFKDWSWLWTLLFQKLCTFFLHFPARCCSLTTIRWGCFTGRNCSYYRVNFATLICGLLSFLGLVKVSEANFLSGLLELVVVCSDFKSTSSFFLSFLFGVIGTILAMIVLLKSGIHDLFSSFLTALSICDTIFLLLAVFYFLALWFYVNNIAIFLDLFSPGYFHSQRGLPPSVVLIFRETWMQLDSPSVSVLSTTYCLKSK